MANVVPDGFPAVPEPQVPQVPQAPSLPSAPAVPDLLGHIGFSVGAKLPDLPVLPGGNLGVGATIPTTPFSLCGFKLPGPIPLQVGFVIPPFSIPLPSFLLSAGISCANLKKPGNPLDFAAGLGWGGGRVGTFDPDPDDPGDDG